MEKVSKYRNIITWGVVGLISFVTIMSSFIKLFASGESEPAQNFAKWGLENKMVQIGILELICGVLFIIPKTFSIGVLLLSAYYGAALATHLEHGEESIAIVPAIILILIWVACYLKRPIFFNSLIINSL